MTPAERRAEAIALARAGQFAPAAQQLEQLLSETPQDAGAWAMLGQLRMELGAFLSAIEALDQAVARNPGRAADHVNRAVALGRIDRHEEALADYDRALAIDPRLATAHANRAQALNELGRPKEAALAAQEALKLRPGDPGALSHLGTAAFAEKRYDAALEAFAQGLQARPGDHDCLCNLGMTLTAMGRHRDAIAHLDAAVAAHPSSALARYRRAHPRLTLGDFAGGWADYERRWATSLFTKRSRGHVPAALVARLTLMPTPADLAGRRVLVIGEQGVGDEILFASILPDLAALAAEVTLVCEPRLARLFAGSFPTVRCLDPEAARALRSGGFDRIVAIGSLAHAFRQRAEDFPGRAFLSPPAERVEAWRSRLAGGDPGAAPVRIGISWRGGLDRTKGAERSMPLEMLAAALSGPGRELVSLQYGEAAAEARGLAGHGAPVRMFDPAEIDDFADLAGLVAALDVVVSVQTAVVHLAGAIGQRALVMIPQRPEWRYGAVGETMPWYGSVRLFRQGPDGGWGLVLAQVAAAVQALERQGSARED